MKCLKRLGVKVAKTSYARMNYKDSSLKSDEELFYSLTTVYINQGFQFCHFLE